MTTKKPFVRRYLDHWVVIIPLPMLPHHVLESHVDTWEEAVKVALIRAATPRKLVDLLPYIPYLKA